MRALRASSVYSGVGLKTISTGRSAGFVTAATEGWAGALGRRSNPAVCTSPDPCAVPRGAGAPLLNPPVVTPPGPFAAPRGEAAALANPPVVTAAAAWLVRAPFVRSKRPVSGGRWITGLSIGRSSAGATAGTIGDGAGTTALATIGATGSGFGTSALITSRIGRGGRGAGRRGATRGAAGNFTSAVAGKMNTILDRVRGIDGFADARIGATTRTTATMACNTTLSHRPVVERPCGHVLNRASSNRIDMCRTELKCPKRTAPAAMLFGELLQQSQCRRRDW
jgi:hypothetical protein